MFSALQSAPDERHEHWDARGAARRLMKREIRDEVPSEHASLSMESCWQSQAIATRTDCDPTATRGDSWRCVKLRRNSEITA